MKQMGFLLKSWISVKVEKQRYMRNWLLFSQKIYLNRLYFKLLFVHVLRLCSGDKAIDKLEALPSEGCILEPRGTELETINKYINMKILASEMYEDENKTMWCDRDCDRQEDLEGGPCWGHAIIPSMEDAWWMTSWMSGEGASHGRRVWIKSGRGNSECKGSEIGVPARQKEGWCGWSGRGRLLLIE